MTFDNHNRRRFLQNGACSLGAIAFLDPSVCDLEGLFSVPPPSLGLATGQS